MDIEKIINYLDNYLIHNNLRSIDPVEANALLNKEGLLKDSKDRPGKPLRALLRKGLLPCAYQLAGKGSHWIIPSSKDNLPTLKHIVKGTQKREPKKIIKENNVKNIDIPHLKNQLENARLKYKPTQINYLLIAQAAPDTLNRFFYYEDVRKHDYLFLGVIKALYPNLKNDFLENGRSSKTKKLILEKFQTDGFYLLDLSELPISKMESNLDSQLPALIKKLKGVVNEKTKIILIKTDVYDIAFNALIKEGFKNVINCRIPFPSQGGQSIFQSQFYKALKLAGYKSTNPSTPSH